MDRWIECVRACVRTYVPFFHYSIQVRQRFAVPYFVKCGLATKLEDFIPEFLLAHGVLCQGPHGEVHDSGSGFVPDEAKSSNLLDELFGGYATVLLLTFPSEDCKKEKREGVRVQIKGGFFFFN